MRRIVLTLTLLLAGCASPVVWVERTGSESNALVPTCWNCGSVAEFESDECLHCGEKYRWVARPGEED